MTKRLFHHDAETGITEYFEPTETGFNIHSVGPTDPIVEMNKFKQSMGRSYYAQDKDMWKVASIPLIVLLKWAEELGVPPNGVFGQEFTDIVVKKLASSEFRDLKTADIRI